MHRPLLLSMLLGSVAATAPLCPPLNNGQPLKALASASAPACFTVSIPPGEASELFVPQPADLELRIFAKDSKTTIDDFDFGLEMATLEAGEYRINVATVSKDRSPIGILMSRKQVPLQEASSRHSAEEAATRAKRSKKVEDYQASLERWLQVGDSSAAGRSYLKIGRSAFNSTNLPSARQSFQEALRLCQSADDFRCVAEAANNGGSIAWLLSEFTEASQLLAAGVAGWDRIGENALKGKTLSNLGLLSLQTGDYEQAIVYLDRAATILRSRDPLANAKVLNNLGLCYQYLGQYPEAMSTFTLALSAFRANKSPTDAARALLNLGRTYMLQGQNALAQKTLEQAIAEAIAVPDRAAHADALGNLGQAQLAASAFSQAKDTLQQALKMHEDLGDKRNQAADLHYLGLTAAALGDPTAARDYLDHSLQIRRDCGLRDPAIDSLVALANLERTSGSLDAARGFADQALQQMESLRGHIPGASLRASFYARRRKVFDLLIDLAAVPDNPHAAEDSLLAAERGRARALLDLLAEGNLTSATPRALLDRRASVQKNLDLLSLRLASAPAAQTAGLRSRVQMLLSEDDQIEAEIRQSLTATSLSHPLDSLPGLQANLPPSTALVEYYLGETQSYLWLVDRDGVRLFRLPARAAIESQCAPVLRLFPAILDRKRSPDLQAQFDRALRRLSTTLLGPLQGMQLPAGIVVVPDGVLTRVPFAALEVAAAHRLGLEHDLIQAPSAEYLEAGNKPRPLADFSRTFLALADPVYAPTDPRVQPPVPVKTTPTAPALARLPFNSELDTVSQFVLPARRKVLVGFAANTENARHFPLDQYAVIHLSAHALIDDRLPEMSRIALSMVTSTGRPIDGFLRPYHLSQLHLNGSVVVLSACDTALGKEVLGEGLAGFTGSLFSAGAAQLVLTLSPIDAEASSEFLSRTYRNTFAAKPVPMERAITQARRSLARSQRWSDPYYWASFIICGRPSE